MSTSALVEKPKYALSKSHDALVKPASSLLASSSAAADWIKPSHTDAIVRLRNSGLALVVLVVLTNLLPVPSPLTSVLVLTLGREANTWTWSFCAAGASTTPSP
jgi:hypothetical protein